MKRTRKWGYVEQEAKRLASLGLAPPEIAKRIGVNPSTVRRWMAAGKLERRISIGDFIPTGQTPEQWAESVRKAYALDDTDDQLVTLGVRAAMIARDPSMSPAVQMRASSEFRAIAKHLRIVAPRSEASAPSPEKAKVEPAKAEPTRRSDPRRLLMAVK